MNELIQYANEGHNFPNKDVIKECPAPFVASMLFVHIKKGEKTKLGRKKLLEGYFYFSRHSEILQEKLQVVNFLKMYTAALL